MAAYVIRRIIAAIPVMLIVSTVVFLLIHMTPGSPAALMLGSQATPQAIAHLSAQMGLNKPLYVQYLDWLSSLLKGNLGQSIFLQEPVSKAIIQHFPPTLMLCVIGMIVAMAIGIPSGILAAIKKGTFWDQSVMVGALFGMSVPEFWMAIVCILLFAQHAHILPAAGYAAPSLTNWNWIRYLIMPGFIMGLVQSGLLARMTRAVVIEVLTNDYVRTAQSKGLRPRRIIVKHILKNALVQILTVTGNILIIFLAGDVAMETIFTIPGIGYMLYNAVFQRDYPLIAGIAVTFGALYVLVNLLVDLSYSLVDARIRY
ncbi:ABC transporter permease [Alicyclobacillus tolerans]|uniref:ABC transporter permease n=1 Tax=Alicyclobacillus tolerans TaxID=90970 RepID=UPI001F278756|nr:ABC transporter permease [Alicyclobacillus tolerans]MCF8565733.1 ABC transporter permease [Alicyclobacillus tolerans]